MSYNKDLVRLLKKELQVERDLELAKVFTVSPNIFSSWKRSKKKLIEEVVKYGVQHNLDFNNIFYADESMTRKKSVFEDAIPVVKANDLFEYSLYPNKVITRLHRYSFPRSLKSDIGFQVVSQNMEPSITVSSIVLGEEVFLENLVEHEVYVLHTLTRGIYVSRFYKKEDAIYLFVNDNSRFGSIEFKQEEISTVFKVNGLISSI